MKHIRFIALTGALLALSASDLVAAPSHTPVVRGAQVRDYARLTFEWPQTVYFSADADGKTVSITFDRKANPDMGALLKQMHPYVTHAERKGDGKTIVLTLARPYQIRTFVSDNVNGIDLLDVNLPGAVETAAPAPEKKEKAAPKPQLAEAPKEKPAKAKPAKRVAASEKKAQEFAALAPAAGEEKPAEKPAEAKPVEAAAEKPVERQPEKTAEPVAAAPIAEPVKEAAAPVAAETPAQPVTLEPSDSNPNPQGVAAVAAPSDTLKISVSAAEDDAVLRLPFAERMAMAVYRRSHMLWIVFHKPVKLDLSEFDNLPKTIIGKPELIPVTGATMIRLPLDDNMFISLTEEENSFHRAILLTAKKRGLNKVLDINVNTDPPAPPHVFVPVLEAADVVKFADPVIGDTVMVAPLFNTGEGVLHTRNFVEFSLLESAQGVVVIKKADEVGVVASRNGLRIATPQGSVLTPGLPQPDQSKVASASYNIATLFPYESWKPASQAAMDEQLYQLFIRVTKNIENPQEANEARLRMAQIYLSEGMAVEAIGQLENINRVNPSYYRSAKLSALRGAAEFLLYRFSEATRSFAASELNNNKEMDYWRSMLSDLLGSSDQNFDYLAMNEDYISKYPPVFRQRLAIVAADRSIAMKEYNTALKIFDTLQKDNIIEPIQHYVNFLMAKISSETGQEKEALEMWDKLAGDDNHLFVQANAEFARIVWGLDHNTVTKDDAINRLENLRLAWHGDSLELNVLKLLGSLYEEKDDYLNAMRVWNNGVIGFPKTSVAIDMTREMQDGFIKIFNEGVVDTLPPLDALAIYYEYRAFIPTGTTGNELIERLADRLISMDLLDQAGSLLDQHMRMVTEKEDRSRIGAKLATIYILNRQPSKALAALQNSMYGENPLMLRLQRNRLTAEAMMELGESEKALATLGQDDSIDAERIRLDVYWKEKDWPKVIANVEGVLKARKDIDAPITLEESESLLKLALAYVFENNAVQLQYLRDYFGPLMVDNPNRAVFEFVTRDDVAPTTANFEEVIKALAETRSFIDSYKARMRPPPGNVKTAAN